MLISIFFAEFDIHGLTYTMGTAENGAKVWRNRDYKFSNLPDYLVGLLLFKLPHKFAPNPIRVVKITVPYPSTLYIAHEAGSRSGGFETSLADFGWTLEADNAAIFTFQYVWKMVVTADNHPIVITLPQQTTDKTVFSIFASGNVFKTTLYYETAMEYFFIKYCQH